MRRLQRVHCRARPIFTGRGAEAGFVVSSSDCDESTECPSVQNGACAGGAEASFVCLSSNGDQSAERSTVQDGTCIGGAEVSFIGLSSDGDESAQCTSVHDSACTRGAEAGLIGVPSDGDQSAEFASICKRSGAEGCVFVVVPPDGVESSVHPAIWYIAGAGTSRSLLIRVEHRHVQFRHAQHYDGCTSSSACCARRDAGVCLIRISADGDQGAERSSVPNDTRSRSSDQTCRICLSASGNGCTVRSALWLGASSSASRGVLVRVGRSSFRSNSEHWCFHF